MPGKSKAKSVKSSKYGGGCEKCGEEKCECKSHTTHMDGGKPKSKTKKKKSK